MPSKHGFILSMLTAIISLVGCEPQLETGYKPRALNASETARRAYYAPAFTPDAAGAKKNSDTGPGFGFQR